MKKFGKTFANIRNIRQVFIKMKKKIPHDYRICIIHVDGAGIFMITFAAKWLKINENCRK